MKPGRGRPERRPSPGRRPTIDEAALARLVETFYARVCAEDAAALQDRATRIADSLRFGIAFHRDPEQGLEMAAL